MDRFSPCWSNTLAPHSRQNCPKSLLSYWSKYFSFYSYKLSINYHPRFRRVHWTRTMSQPSLNVLLPPCANNGLSYVRRAMQLIVLRAPANPVAPPKSPTVCRCPTVGPGPMTAVQSYPCNFTLHFLLQSNLFHTDRRLASPSNLPLALLQLSCSTATTPHPLQKKFNYCARYRQSITRLQSHT